MEGAAFMQACLIHDVVFAQVRAVSNVVERRNRDAWKLAEAIGSLGSNRAEHPRSRMTLSLGFSPCPNDCFMFDAIVHQRIDTRRPGIFGMHGRCRGAEQGGVCRRGRRHQAELSRVRVLRRRYVLLDAGSALGRNCGPLLISKRPIAKDEVAAGRAQNRDSRQVHHRQFPPRPGVSSRARHDRARVLGNRGGVVERRIRCRGSSSTRTGSPTRPGD